MTGSSDAAHSPLVPIAGRRIEDPQLAEIMSAALTWARSGFNNLLAAVDDGLFDLAEQTQNNAAQAELFAALRRLRRDRDALRDHWLNQVAEGFHRFQDGTPPAEADAVGLPESWARLEARLLCAAPRRAGPVPAPLAQAHLVRCLLRTLARLDLAAPVRELLVDQAQRFLFAPFARLLASLAPVLERVEARAHPQSPLRLVTMTADASAAPVSRAQDAGAPGPDGPETGEDPSAAMPSGRERIQQALAHADVVVDHLLRGRRPPMVLEQFFNTAWHSMLLLTALRHGVDSPQWRDLRTLADDLLWTVEPKESAADVARLQSMLPRLCTDLRAGLDMVAYSGDDVAALFSELESVYRSRVAAPYRDKLHMPSLRAATPFRRMEQLSPAQMRPLPPQQLREEGPAASSEPPARRPGTYVKGRVGALKPGSWLEFTDARGGKVRAKLSWISPISKKYLFVTEQGTKLADKTFAELSDEIASGQTLILDPTPAHLKKSPATPAPRQPESEG